MDLDLVFLGTSGSAPTATRSPTALLVRRGGDRLLFDCAEGTQRQLMRSTVGLPDLDHIFISHFHADHYLGLPGMLKTFSLRQRETPLTVYGPPGLRDLFADLRRMGDDRHKAAGREILDADQLVAGRIRQLAYAQHRREPLVPAPLDRPRHPGRQRNRGRFERRVGKAVARFGAGLPADQRSKHRVNRLQ